QLGGKAGKTLVVAVGIAPLDRQVLSLVVAEPVHAAQEGRGKRIVTGRARTRARGEETNAPNLARLLGACRERPRQCRAAEERDEFTSLHSITSSAVASSVGDIVMPVAFAVLRLITSSNFVGCST